MLVALALIGSAAPAMAASIAQPPLVSISISSELGIPVFQALKYSSYSFGTSIEFPGGYLNRGDIYFGVFLPGRDNMLVWVKDGQSLVLQDKMIPIAKGVDLKEKSVFNLSTVLGQDIQYAFNGTEPAGMYLIFTLVTASGTDPANTQNWISINMSPLFFNP